MFKKYISASILALSFSVVTPSLLALPAYAATAMDFSSLVEKEAGAVVRINIVKSVSDEELALAYQAQVLRQFFGNHAAPDIPTVEHGYGSGFFVSSDGYILTNHHVVAGAKSITVTLNDRSELDARLIGSDEASDIAVLKVAGKNFPALKMASGDNLKVGEPVLAIGSPFGFDYSASAGIVSAKSRNISKEATVPFIQTDVALNPGNSGGPLFNQYGEVVGVNSRIFSGTGGYMGLSFSIPIDTAMDIYKQIKQTGKVTRAYLGVGLQDIDQNLAEAYGFDKPKGAVVTRVAPDSPAQKSGLKAGDVVLSLNGQTINQASELLNQLNRAKPQESFNLSVWRDKKSLSLQGVFADSPQDVAAGSISNDKARLGLRVKELTSSENAMLSAYDVRGGLVISAIEMSSLAERAGLQVGDIIVSLNQMPTYNISAFKKAAQNLPQTGVVTIGVIRNGTPVILGIRME